MGNCPPTPPLSHNVCPPTPPLSHNVALSEKKVLMLT